MNKISISVVIPVKNEAKNIGKCLDGILKQTVEVDEIIVIDSGSSDGTQEIVRNYSKTKLLEIDPEEFNHGSTRNKGLEISLGEYVLFTVGDARPVSRDWIEKLMEGFVDDSVAGVCGTQVVARENTTNPVEWYKPINKQPKLRTFQYSSPQEFEEAPTEEKRYACAWDNVTAMCRKSVMKEYPFKSVSYGEDIH